MRKSIHSQLKNDVLEDYDYRCVKCRSSVSIDVHHITAVMDGGKNDKDNLIPLCQKCHKEWHFVESVSPIFDFRKWLELPPYPIMVLIWDDNSESVALWEKVKLIMSSMGIFNKESDEE